MRSATPSCSWSATAGRPTKHDIGIAGARHQAGTSPPQGRQGTVKLARKCEDRVTAPIKRIYIRAIRTLVSRAYMHLLTQWMSR